MGRKSKAKEARSGVPPGPLRDALSPFTTASLRALVEAASASPTSSHRQPSLGLIVDATLRRKREGKERAPSSALSSLLEAAHRQEPMLASLEDTQGLDPRPTVVVRWRGALYRLLPGSLERPVAMMRGPVLGDARVVLKESMSAGEIALIPFPLGTLGVRFEEVSTLTYVLLVVALFDQDETPQAAMWAGCRAFSNELRAAIVQRLPFLRAAVTQGDDAELQRLIAEIKTQVKTVTESATWNALTGWQKTRVILGTLNLDDYVGFAFYFGKPARTDLELILRSDSGSEEYRVEGSIDIQATTVDLCQTQADAVKEAQDVVDGIEGQINAAKAMLHDAAPAQKAAIVAQITQLNQDLDVAMMALDEARRVLQRCRDRWGELAEIRSAVEGVSVVNPL